MTKITEETKFSGVIHRVDNEIAYCSLIEEDYSGDDPYEDGYCAEFSVNSFNKPPEEGWGFHCLMQKEGDEIIWFNTLNDWAPRNLVLTYESTHARIDGTAVSSRADVNRPNVERPAKSLERELCGELQ